MLHHESHHIKTQEASWEHQTDSNKPTATPGESILFIGLKQPWHSSPISLKSTLFHHPLALFHCSIVGCPPKSARCQEVNIGYSKNAIVISQLGVILLLGNNIMSPHSLQVRSLLFYFFTVFPNTVPPSASWVFTEYELGHERVHTHKRYTREKMQTHTAQ